MLAIFSLALLIFTQTTLASSSDDDWLDLRDPSRLLDAEKRYADKYAARLMECEQDPIDLGLIIDCSSSVYILDFEKGMEFLASFLDEFDIGPEDDQVRVAAVTFGLGVYAGDGFNFTTYDNKDEMKNHLLNMPHRAGISTDTGKALEYMRDIQMRTGRPWAVQMEVVLTDGDSGNGTYTKIEALKTKASNITVFAVGVGKVKDQELVNITGGVTDHKFYVANYSALGEDLKNNITKKTCKHVITPKPPPVCNQEPIDLGLIIDCSTSVYIRDFEKGLNFLADFLDEFNIGPDDDQVRVAAVTFGLGVYVMDGFNFTTYDNKDEMKNHLLNMPHRAGISTDTGKALKYMRELQMATRRSRAVQMEVLITDGKSGNGTYTKIEAMKSKASDITVLAVGVGEAEDDELLNIAGSVNDHAFHVANYSLLNEDFKNKLTLKTCEDVENQMLHL